MREMRKDIAVIKMSHIDFRNNHLKKRRESGENTKLVRCKSKTGSGRKVASFHDTGWDENMGIMMFLVDNSNRLNPQYQMYKVQLEHIN